MRVRSRGLGGRQRRHARDTRGFPRRRRHRLCRADGASLAAAIAGLAADAAVREKIARGAANTLAERFSTVALGRAWEALLDTGTDANLPLLGVSILNFNDADATLRCLTSLAQSSYPNVRVLVLDNGSSAKQRQKLEAQMAGRFDATVRWLDSNTGYARANNLAVETLFERHWRSR